MVSAIIPAYNEEKTIGEIVAVLKTSPLIKEVIVIDDGSEDGTAKKALEKGAQVIRLPKNRGKGEALAEGIRRAKEEILLFLDADLTGLRKKHIRLLAMPVLKGSFDMTIGSVDRGRRLNQWLSKFESPFAGIRVLRKSFWQEIPSDFKKGYFIESALTYFAKKKNRRTKGFILKGVKHIIKERKHGFWQGIFYRLRMVGEIALVNFLLRIHF
jgi:glycosyltransferase involved in cell wall biosynthesis